MKYIKQFFIILLISFLGEALHALLPLPIPASIYGIVLLFAASNPLGLTLSILFLALMYKVAQIPFKMILKSLKPILDSLWAWGEAYKSKQ